MVGEAEFGASLAPAEAEVGASAGQYAFCTVLVPSLIPVNLFSEQKYTNKEEKPR